MVKITETEMFSRTDACEDIYIEREHINPYLADIVKKYGFVLMF